MARFIRSECSALCGKTLAWKPGQEWKRCSRCGTLNYAEGGARLGMMPLSKALAGVRDALA